jgi:hypothetical protein
MKPHLTTMWFETKASTSDVMQALKNFIERVIGDLGKDVIPYARTFYQEVLDGSVVEPSNQDF